MCDTQETNKFSATSSPDGYSGKATVAQSRIKDKSPDGVISESNTQDLDTVSAILLNKLSDGVLSLYVSDLRKASCSLSELTRNQSIVIETLEQESTRVVEALSSYQFEDMFAKIKQYHTKLQILKKDMLTIHERTSKLKKRAMKLQQQKQREALQKELQRDREMERDKQLAPKIVTKCLLDK